MREWHIVAARNSISENVRTAAIMDSLAATVRKIGSSKINFARTLGFDDAFADGVLDQFRARVEV